MNKMVFSSTIVHFQQIYSAKLHFWQSKNNINVENFKIELSHYTTTVTIP